MIVVDRRDGSSEYAVSLRSLGAAVSVEELPFGDFSFHGQGHSGVDVSIGIELKTLHDLISSIDTGRLAGHQIPGLLELYDERYLFVEGLWRPGPAGVLETWRRAGWETLYHGRRAYMYSAIDNFLSSVANQTPIKVKRTSTSIETAAAIYNLARWWEKGYDSHHSLSAVHVSNLQAVEQTAVMWGKKRETVRYRAKCIAKQLPAIGDKKLDVICDSFQTIEHMMTADWTEWEKIAGIGRKMAEDIRRLLTSPIEQGESRRVKSKKAGANSK